MTTLPSITPRTYSRLAEIGAARQGKALRVLVEGGGCSGFQYLITLDDARPDDIVFSDAGETVVIDPVSLPFLEQATITYSEELIGARFLIENPAASGSCGCGTSFAL
ncbi:MAG: iron-sulfur cluster assembly accessory protein [Rubellimicrobium sp.]|nr:iron-sulfur cluster assembly accessory protein [Rubellimicrobium sp.]